MGSVYVRIGQDDNFVIAELADIEIVANATSKGGNHGFDFVVDQYFFQGCFFHI